MQERTVNIPNISCEHCYHHINHGLSDIKGFTELIYESGSKDVTIRWEKPAEWKQILKTLDEIGYPVEDTEATLAG